MRDDTAMASDVSPAFSDSRAQVSDATHGMLSVLSNGAFARLWTAQIFSQVAQNTVFASMLAQIQLVTGSSTNVVFVIASGLLPQVLLSSFAGVLVDRVSKRAVLVASNLLRVLCVGGYLSFQTTPWVLLAMVFASQAIGQFFAPAEAAVIPLLVRREGLMAATSLFNLSFNAAQVVPFGLGLLLLSFIGLTKLLLGVIVLFVLAAALVGSLPSRTTRRPPRVDAARIGDELRRARREIVEGIRFVSRDSALRLALVQINITPTVLLLFGVLGAGYVQRVIHLRPDNLYVLLVPAGIGLLLGTWLLGQFGGRVRRESIVHVGVFALGGAVVAMGILPPIIRVFHDATHLIPSRPYLALTYPAMAIAVIVGLAMALTTVPTQTIVFERSTPEIRGRVLAMQQWLGGAVPLVPLLVIGPLVDVAGIAPVLVAAGSAVLVAGWLGVRSDARNRATDLIMPDTPRLPVSG